MELSLTKLPWYAQVGAFVALAAGGCGIFYYYYEMPVRADMSTRESMQTVATQSNLELKSFKPAPTVPKQLHAEGPITLELEGTYHNLAIFFDRVGKFTRIVNINGLDLKGKDKPEPNATITATCVATTFVLLDPKAAAGRGAKPAATPAPGGKGA